MTDAGGSSSSGGTVPIKLLKNKRGQVKSQCTRYTSYLEEIDLQNTSLIELRQRLHKFNETWDVFNGIQASIEDIECEADYSASHDEERRLFEERYFAITSKLESLIEAKVGSTQALNLNHVPRFTREGTPATQGSSANEHLKLPRINLPTFAGSFEDWISFRNMFQTMIHQNATLPNVQKMQYLIVSLKGEARDMVGSLEVSDENYSEAWEMLKERYDDTGLIIQKHIKALFEVPVIVKENHVLLRRALDNVLKHLRALKALRRPTEYWDDLIVYVIASRLNQKTSRAWETTVKRGEVPTLKQLSDFLSQHSKALEASARPVKVNSNSNSERGSQPRSTAVNVATTSSKCAYCSKEEHIIYKCKDFLDLEIEKRIQEARSRKLCLNCLRSTLHQARQCSIGPCRKCNKRHNTLLHLESTVTKKPESKSEDASSAEDGKVVATSINHVSFKQGKQVLLATATVKIPINVPVSSLEDMSTQANKSVQITMRSRVNNFTVNLNCLIIKRIVQVMPTDQINTNELQIPEGIVLADPSFYETNKIDLLLGAEIFFDLMCIGRVKKSNGQPTWQKTLLGWIVAGKLIAHNQEQKSTICSLVMNEQLNFSLVKFWQLESSERQTTRSPEERICEGHFARTYKRDESGRFIVSLPTREEQLSKIGDSRDLAIQRLKKLEKRFERQPTLKKKYSKFLQEYLDLQHMREIRQDNVKWMVRPQYYLPHHCVIKESSITTKLRVVFDASAKGSNGISLNDALMSGPVVQQDLFSILLRFRSFKYVMTSDIAKMYRQIRLDENQVPLQRIVWRENPTEEIKTYELLTLTYGTAPASFLATKVIQQLADIEEEQFPKGAAIASWDFYMDDLLTGADTIKEAIIIRNQVTELLAKGGFILRKWTFNNKELLKGMPECAVEHVTLDLDKDSITKTLGINWNPQEDALQYFIKVPHLVTCTKRIILSSIAQIFDPLGLLAPVIITAKILIQELWRLQLDWDESLPADIFSKWANCVENMQHLQAFRVPRRVLGDGDKKEIQLHGFSDASEKAYGACIYLRSSDQNEILQSCLLCAKSRVAPLRAISIPRLELCGAQLLVQLMSKVKAALSLNVAKVYYWTDSSIVLHWIKATNKKLPVFVAHRIGEIQELSSVEDWNHVGTKENPADLVSRGSDARELCDSLLWWNGPSWLKNHIQVDQLSDSNNFEEDQSDSLNEQVVLTTIPQSSESFINRFSTFQRLVRVAATCIRFARRCRRNRQESSQDLTLEELEYSKRRLIGMEQLSGFQSEIQALRSNKPIPKSSSLKYLNPFLDDEGLLRVGGRLRHADLGYEVKHQWVLPHHSRLTDLIIIYEHLRNFHAGAEATLASVRQFYWPIRARGTVKGLLHKCVKCFRSRPRISQQIMGDLPVERVTPARPFVNTGVDFCGPIYVRPSKGRGIKRLKAYIAIFVCMTVKAVHLEIVSDLSTEAFLNAFKRFISRRERPANVYSDNGTNFVGANRDLNRCRELLSCEKGRNIIDFSNCEGIKWHFTPARAPHFGGLWESAVKSFKAYFYKTAADAAMTFEEAFTLISQIEAILNSRPIIAISTDPNDLNYLSPGHFLIGTTLTSYPELNLTDATIGRLSRWQMIEQMRQHFWKRWSTEYLFNLQRRNKWLSNNGSQLQVGQLVVCREDNLPPLKWALGRVKEIFPGSDKVVRTAIIKTANGEYKRPAVKLCILPTEDYLNKSKNV